jgi:membrane protein implicated in regulation of membrane protease activity
MLNSDLLNKAGAFPEWVWITIGLVLLAAEVLGAGGFLLGTGVAALLVGGSVYLFGVEWQGQLFLFAILSVGLSYLYIRHMRPNADRSEDPLLNNKMARLVGRRTKLIKAVENGTGRVQIQDAFWTVQSDQDMPEGATVKIVAYEGSILHVEPSNPESE